MDEQRIRGKSIHMNSSSNCGGAIGFTHRSRLPVDRWVWDRPSSRVPIPHYLQWVHTEVEC